jgi:pilus assembly protein Flp/PilA
MKDLFTHLWKDEEGQDLTEYGLVLVLIALICVVSIGAVGQAVSNIFSNAAQNLSTATT